MNLIPGAASVALVIALGAGSLWAQAEDSPSRWEVTPFAGLQLGTSLYRTRDTLASASDAVTYGARLAYWVSPSLALEASYTRTEPDLEAPSTAAPGRTSRLGRLGMHQLGLDLLLAFSSPREAIYAVLGGGLALLDPEVLGATELRNTRPSATVGVGYRRFFGRSPLGVRIDGRMRWIFTPSGRSPGITCLTMSGCFTYKNGSYGAGELSAAAVVRF